MMGTADAPGTRPPRRRRGSPPYLNLPWWFWVAVAIVWHWYFTVPAAFALAVAGWYGAGWTRWPAIGGAAILTLPFAGYAVSFFVRRKREASYWRTLRSDETVAGLPWLAGSRLHFADTAHTDLISVDLPRVAELWGIRVTGRVTRHERWRDAGPCWSVMLAEDQWLDGLPSRAGAIGFDKDYTVLGKDGGVERCELAAAHQLFGLQLPRGTTVQRGHRGKPWYLLLPADAGVALPTLGATAPAGVTLYISDDSSLEEMGSAHGQTILIRGVRLQTEDLRIEGEQVAASLAEPCAVAGDILPAGARVHLRLATGAVSVYGR
jgi:hypothetical protein